MLRIYKSIQPAALFLVILTGSIFWLKALILPEEVSMSFYSVSMPLYHPVGEMFDANPVWSLLISFFIILILGFMLVRLNTTYFFINQRSYLPALFYYTGTGILVSMQSMNPAILSGFFLVVAIHRMFSTYKYQRTAFQYFDSGLLLGIGSLFYLNLGFYLPFLWIGLIILRPFNWREWISPLLGFLTPFGLLIAIFFLLPGEVIPLFENLKNNIVLPGPDPDLDIYSKVLFAFLGFLILIFSIHMIRSFSIKKVSSRKYLNIILWLFILTLLIYFLVPSASMELIYILFIPLSYLFTHFFVSIRSHWTGNLLLFLYFAAIAVNQIL